MNYRVRVGGRECEVSLVALPGGRDGPARFEARLDGGKAVEVAAWIDDDALYFSLDGRLWRALVDPAPGEASELHVFLRGEAHRVEISRGAPQGGALHAGEGAGALRITSPMPGRVVTVRVKVGERVARGDLLLTLEAMKMQNEFASPAAGAVTAVKVKPGEVAAAGQVLVEILPDPRAG